MEKKLTVAAEVSRKLVAGQAPKKTPRRKFVPRLRSFGDQAAMCVCKCVRPPARQG